MKGSSGLIFVLFIFFTLLCACGGEVKPVVNLSDLAGKSAKDVDAALGAPIEVTPTGDEGTTPGEFRDYKILGVTPRITSGGLTVRFYRDRAVHFTLELPDPTSSPEKALALAGINVPAFSQDSVNPLAIQWSGTFNGVSFKRISAQRLGDDSMNYTLVQAEIF